MTEVLFRCQKLNARFRLQSSLYIESILMRLYVVYLQCGSSSEKVRVIKNRFVPLDK